MDLSLWEILQSHATMWVLVGLSVLAIAVALERVVVLWRFMERARTLHDTVSRCLVRGALDEGRSACERSRSPLADVYLVGYERLGRVKRASLDAAVHRERLRVTTAMKSHLWILGTIGAMAPFVGLFGTVIGIIHAFRNIQEANTAGLGVVGGDISMALYATAAGILVAIEAVIIYNYFNQRLGRVAVELRMLTEEYLELLDEHGPSHVEEAKPAAGGDDEDKGKSSGAREAA